LGTGSFWQNLARELNRVSILNLALIAVLASLCGTIVLYLLNKESSLVQQHEYSKLTAIGFVFLLVVYRISQRRLINSASASIEEALHDWRQRITGKVLRLSLRDIEDITPGQLIDGLARHYTPLSQAVVTLVAGVEAMILLAFMYTYLIFLSPTAALLTAVVAGLCVAAYFNVAAELGATMKETSALTAQLDRTSESSIKGSKELRLDAAKRRAILEDMVTTSEKLGKSRAQSASIFAEVISSGNTASYLMAGAVVFVLPILSSMSSNDVPMIVMAVIFLVGPIGGVIGCLQQLAIARFAVSSILEFEGRVDGMLADNGEEAEQQEAYTDFHTIELNNVGYTHPKALDIDTPFGIKNVSLQIPRGKLLFVSGGNGSGKTTLLRVLTGLYPRAEGEIRVDDRPIARRPGQTYRDLFSIVFSDFHVFDRAYALDEKGFERLDDWLTRLKIRNKLPADMSKGFSPDALSTGQRKRLALAFALAEDRPVLILDEWAADQDPATRRRFYEEILPALKATGKTIIAVTHDEKYFSRADCHAHMEDGLLNVVSAPREESAA
jgi:putative ATP-binding cassette transporter